MRPLRFPLRRRSSARRGAAGFTILEVGLTATILALGIVTSLTALQFGMRQVDTARSMTLAGQIMQSEMEIIRLQNWSQIVALQTAQASPTTPATVNTANSITSGSSTPLDATLTTIANRFTCTRLVEDVSGKTDMKQITLVVSWTGVDGRGHSLRFQTRYSKNGLSDYFYVAH
jgi:type II secretory pathway pseudopilin PulG